MNHEAIYALYPNVVSIDDTAGAFDKDGKSVEINMSQVNAWVNPEQYKYDRAAEYPDFREYLDGIVKNDKTQINKYIADCQAVKLKYPKPE